MQVCILKKSLAEHIPHGKKYNATELMKKTIATKGKVIHHPFIGYWFDIGRSVDYHKAREMANHFNYS